MERRLLVELAMKVCGKGNIVIIVASNEPGFRENTEGLAGLQASFVVLMGRIHPSHTAVSHVHHVPPPCLSTLVPIPSVR